MNLRFFGVFLFALLLGKTDTFSQVVQPKISESHATENPILWSFQEAQQMLDSLDRANPVDYWSRINKFGLDISEVTFFNWNAGGANSISFLFNSQISRTYEKGFLRWKSEAVTRYGMNAEKGNKIRKTDDLLELNSTFGYRTGQNSNWFYSAKLNLKTQFSKGYNYPNRENHISNFLAPGYLFSGIGADFAKDSDKFSLYLSPATLKTTFVLDRTLSDAGAFGVRKADYDADGNLLRRGKQSKSEFGILITNEYNTKIFENISMAHRLTLYTDYVKNFGNIDVDWRLDFNFKVNNFVAARIGSHLIYDDDTKTKRTNSLGEEYNGGAKIQWKQQLGIGVVFDI